MSNKDKNIADNKAMDMLQKAVDYAEKELLNSGSFRPFGVVLDSDDSEIIENMIEDVEESYDKIGEEIELIIACKTIDIVVLAIETNVPERLAHKIEDDPKSSIRLHIEEKSQVGRVISARYIYIPYQLYQKEPNELFIKFYNPLPVGLKAEYITKEKHNIELI
ncbi:MAG: hypothetical protein QM493_10000 [Sulfurovum sp.]